MKLLKSKKWDDLNSSYQPALSYPVPMCRIGQLNYRYFARVMNVYVFIAIS